MMQSMGSQKVGCNGATEQMYKPFKDMMFGIQPV